MTAPKKPETLVYSEVHYEIFNFINKIIAETGIPFFQLEIIINKLAGEVSEYAKKERETALAEYKSAMETHAAENNASTNELTPSEEPIDTTTAETTEE